MQCIKVHSRLSAFVDDALELEEKAKLIRHLQGCPACSQELDEYLAVQRLFQSAERFNAPHFFSKGVMARINADKRSWLETFFIRQSLYLRFVEIVFALLIMLIGIFSGNVLMTDRSTGRPPATVQEMLPLYAFETTPAGSVADIYIELTGVGNER